MNWHLHQLKYAMGLGGIMSFYGIVAMIVWIAGTQFGWQIGSRMVVIALILITMPFALIIGFVASRRKKKKEEKAEEKKDDKKDSAEEKEADEKGEQKLKKPSGTYENIDKSSAEVVQFLKDSNLGESSKESVYSLPWYVVAGTPKSGKSSLVIGSRLDFQNLPSQRQSELKFVRPTRGIDWRVTADAVFVDTAGRYQTEGVDQDEWASLIETIKKHRPKRPIDGFLLVVNTEQILESNNAEVEQMAKILRTRLDEAMERIKVRFPVYLIFTHADGIEGFKDSFSRSKREGKNLVWGSTIPLEKSENGQTLFDNEYALLQDSVMKRRILRLSAPFPPVSQLRIFNFPLHFGSARRKIGAFVSTLFRPNPFSESPFLRGFYFTSAPSGRNNGNRGGARAAQTVGTTHFTERFFRDVLLRDKDLVRATQLQKKGAPIFGWLLTGFATIITLLLLVMSGVSLYNNSQLLDTSVEKGSAVIDVVKDDKAKGKNPLDKEPTQVQTELEKIDDLRDFMENNLEKYDREGTPLHLRFGLYTGDEIYKDYLLPTYFNAIEQRFKAPMIKRIEGDLQNFSKSNPVKTASNISKEETDNLDTHYNLLKAYLMLTEKYQDKAESTHLTNTLEKYWINESKIPENLRLKAENQLKYWVTQTDREDFPHIAPDDQLVSDVRAKLQAFPAANRFYKAEVARINEELEQQNVKITVQNILNENNASSNFIEGDYKVPSAYTRAGFALLNKSLTSEDTKLDQPDWVMGEETKKPTEAGEGDVETVKNLYLRDYAEHWTKFVQSIEVKPFSRNDIDFAKDALDSFSSANSSIVVVTREIARNTSFTEEIEDAAYAWYNPVGWYYSIMNYFESTEDLGTDKYTEVERDFQSLHDLFRIEKSSKGDPTPPKIEKYRDIIGSIAQDFKPLSRSEIIRIEESLNKEKKHPFIKKLDSESKDLDGLLKDFKTPSAKALANLYKQPFNNLRNLLGAGLKQQIEKKWEEDILSAAKDVEKSYPFSDSGNEINMKDLTAFLNPTDGKLSLFYKENLAPYFDGKDEDIRLKEGVDVQFREEFINYLKNAFRLRKALYGGKAKPEFKYNLTLTQVNNVIVEGTIDGLPVKSEGTGSADYTFPASSGENGVIIRFDSTGEAPTGNNTANTPNSNVNTNTTNALQDNSGCRSGANPIRCPGTWGLFRFFEAGNPVKEGNGYKLNYSYKGKTISATITPNGGDLFDKKIFTSLRAPDAILK